MPVIGAGASFRARRPEGNISLTISKYSPPPSPHSTRWNACRGIACGTPANIHSASTLDHLEHDEAVYSPKWTKWTDPSRFCQLWPPPVSFHLGEGGDWGATLVRPVARWSNDGQWSRETCFFPTRDLTLWRNNRGYIMSLDRFHVPPRSFVYRLDLSSFLLFLSCFGQKSFFSPPKNPESFEKRFLSIRCIIENPFFPIRLKAEFCFALCGH